MAVRRDFANKVVIVAATITTANMASLTPIEAVSFKSIAKAF